MSSKPTVQFCVAVFAILFAALSNAHPGHTRALYRQRLKDSRNGHTAKQVDLTYLKNLQKQNPAKSSDEDVLDDNVLYDNVQNVTHSTLETFDTNVTYESQIENMTESNLDFLGTNVTSMPREENVTNSILERYSTNITSVPRGENVTNSSSELYSTDITSVPREENITDSTFLLYDTNVTSLPQRQDVTGLTLEFLNTNVTSVLQKESSTSELMYVNFSSVSLIESRPSSDLEFSNTNVTSVSLGENMTDSSLNLFDTSVTSVSQEENVTILSLVLSETNATSVTREVNVTGSSFDAFSKDDNVMIKSDTYNRLIEHNSETNLSNSNTGMNVTNNNSMLFNATKGKDDANNSRDPNLSQDYYHYSSDYDYHYESEEQYSVRSSSEGHNTDPDPAINSNCSACRKRSIDRHYRILQFKNQILNMLHITNLPNTTGVSLPKFPALAHLYETEADLMSDSSRSDGHPGGHVEYEDDVVAKTERVFIPAKEAPLALHLNLTGTVYFPPAVQLFTSQIRSAYLWFYIQKHNPPPSHVTIERILPDSKSARSFVTKTVFFLQLDGEKAFGWKKVDLHDTLRQWIQHPMTNFGLLLKAEDNDGNNLIVLPPAPEMDKSYEPWLDTKIIEARHSSRRRRSESLMCVENSTDSRCCRHPLLVGFAEFGWDWIIAPTHVNADYCTGECRMTMQDHTPYSWVNQQMTGTNSCCTPTKLSPLPLLYFDESMNIVYQILQNMKVDKCGCV